MIKRFILAALSCMLLAGQAIATTQPLSGGSGGTLSTTQSNYAPFGLVSTVTTALPTATSAYPVMPTAGVISNLTINLITAPGGTTSRVFTLLKNGSTTAATCTITGTAGSCSDTSDSVSVAAGDWLAWEADIGSGTPTASFVYVSATFTPTVANETVLFARLATSSNSATTYGGIQTWFGNWLTTESSAQKVIPDVGTLSDIYIQASSNTGGATKSYTFGVNDNGTPTTIVAVLASSTATTTNNTSFSATTVAGDLYDFTAVPANTPSNNLTMGEGIKFVSSTSGNVVFMGSASSVDNATTAEYFPGTGDRPITATEVDGLSFVPNDIHSAFTVTALYGRTNTAPGGSATRTINFRVNGVTLASCTIPSGGTTCSATGLSVYVPANNYYDYQDAPSGSPATGLMSASVVGNTITPPPAATGGLTLKGSN